jgi:AcrR family transcriptional regulator
MEPLAAHSKREWILVGMAESCAARGYERTSVDDVCAAAGVERGSFDELFADKADCLAAAMEMALTEMRERIAAVSFPKKPWAATVRDGTAALLEFLAERPALASMALVEAPAAGGRAAELYAEGRAAARSFLERGRDETAERSGIPASAGRAAMAGAEGLVVGQILTGETKRLGECVADVAYMLMVPYLGQSEALREAGRQTAFRHLRAVA